MARATIDGVIQGEFGKTITLTCRHPTSGASVDISGYDGTKTIRVRGPKAHRVITATCTFTTDGTDGKVNFSFAKGDLDRDGKWEGTVELAPATDSESAKTYIFDMEVGEAV